MNPQLVCSRCHTALAPDGVILHDAERRGITLDFIPLRCRYGHSARLERPRPPMRLVPTCGFCEQVVLDRSLSGKQLLNHPACAQTLLKRPEVAIRPHRYVEVAR